jgi:midasin
LARVSGHKLVRINLSEQTDLSDLLGSDMPLPVSDEPEEEGAAGDGSGGGGAVSSGASGGGTSNSGGNNGGNGPQFAWCDGVLLQAVKNGDWVLLDELNLAPQAVLEGLNAILDHRAEVYIPELDRTFECPRSFRVFGAQNPLLQGGGRKGLPKSFLNRFTKVHVDALTDEDLVQISASLFPELLTSSENTTPASDIVTFDSANNALATDALANDVLLRRCVAFNQLVMRRVMVERRFGQLGSPWEYNLRDIDRLCSVALRCGGQLHGGWNLRTLVDVVYAMRLRTEDDRVQLLSVFDEVFANEGSGANASDASPAVLLLGGLRVTSAHATLGTASLKRFTTSDGDGDGSGSGGGVASGSSLGTSVVPVLQSLLRPLHAMMHCVAMKWPCLLVGGRGSGKSSCLRLLASLCGE